MWGCVRVVMEVAVVVVGVGRRLIGVRITTPASLAEAGGRGCNVLNPQHPRAFAHPPQCVCCIARYPLPNATLNADYGEPTGLCEETRPGSEVGDASATRSPDQQQHPALSSLVFVLCVEDVEERGND